MYLLSHKELRNHIHDAYKDYLSIIDFEEEMLQHTFYYFRLGTEYEIKPSQKHTSFNPTGDEQNLLLQPYDYATIRSHETFKLSDKVMGILGQSSDLIRTGLELAHSPFVDPLYHGKLEMGIWNRLSIPVSIKLGQVIRKVAFFDVSDSSPIKVLEGSIVGQKFKKRVPLRDDDPVPDWVEEEDPHES